MGNKLYGELSSIPGSCGIGLLGDLSLDKDEGDRISKTDCINAYHGAGFLCVGFVDCEPCRVAFEKLTSWFPILYQSPIRVNSNSGNNFFFMIFDTGLSENHSYKSFDTKLGYGFKSGLTWSKEQ